MKTTSFKDGEGKAQTGWKFGTFTAWNAGGNVPHRGKYISGWQIQSPDGCLRSNEGNWNQFVPFANQILENYGMTSRLS